MLTWLVVILLVAVLPQAFALQAKQDQGMVVGHLAHLQGNLFRQTNNEADWVPLVKDSPLGPGDVLLSENNSQAEIIIPNNTWLRIGGDTRIQIIDFENDRTEINMDWGMARFYNKSTSATIKAMTPFGSVLAPPLTTFDAYLDKDAVQVTAVSGTVHFSHIADNSSHEVRAGISSLRADYHTITAGEEMVDEAFNHWNAQRDSLWAERLEEQTDTQKYLPQNLQYSSYALQENGIWETVYYQGRNCSFWRPTHVSSYWSPFTVGSWTVWYGDHCWIPYEPFGYLTHHYGNWIYLDSCDRWYWAPPGCHSRINDLTVLVIPLSWYPGRVSWIYSNDCIGWIPLAPYEPYYCFRPWGPYTYVVGRDRLRHLRVTLDDCRYKKHAVVVKKHDFYTAINYNTLRVKNRGNGALEGYQRVAAIYDREVKHFRKMNPSFISRGRPEKPTLTLPATGKMKQFKPRDAMLTGKIMPVNRKRLDIGNTVNPMRKPLSTMQLPSEAMVSFRNKYKGSGLSVSRTSPFSKTAQGIDHARTKLRESQHPQVMVAKRRIQSTKALPDVKRQRSTIAPPSVFRNPRPQPSANTQRPTGVLKIQPLPSRSTLDTGRPGLSQPGKAMGGGEKIRIIRGSTFSRVRAR